MSCHHLSPQGHFAQRFAVVIFVGLAVSFAGLSSTQAWDETGHKIITELAIASLPADLPGWLSEPDVRAKLICLASLPDNWRGQHSLVLDHINTPDHYIDEELLYPYGLSIKTLPRFRREFTDMMATKRALHPEKFKPYNRKRDKSYTRLSPGFAPYRISELHWKTAGNWTLLKTFEQERDLVTDSMVQTTKDNITYSMGILSHYVGDGAQPLHTTHHHHGWKGQNPKGYTTEYDFHEYIDGGVIAHHGITAQSLMKRILPPKKIAVKDEWKQLLAYLYATWELHEPLYALEKSGDLNKQQGKVFIEDRLLEAASMLSGLWIAEYKAAHIDDFQVNLLRSKAAKAKKPRKAAQAETKPLPVALGVPSEHLQTSRTSQGI